MVNVLAMPVVVGLKTAKERFAGAVNSLTCEGMMGDGKALQMGTSHEFGQNFAKVFGIDYLDDTGAQQTACTTSWGVSTRMIGGLIMAAWITFDRSCSTLTDSFPTLMILTSRSGSIPTARTTSRTSSKRQARSRPFI
jgi:prolyl-tRNA synthetase